MSADLTIALGKLLSDAALRERLRRDPEAASTLLDINVATLRELDLEGLEAQAQGLIDKRFHEVAKRLPRTLAGLGARTAGTFREYATGVWPEGHDRHLQDAAAFGDFLKRRGLPVCRSELNRVRFTCGRMPISIRLAPDVWVAGRSRWAVQVLIRRAAGVRSLAFYLGL
jgi:hypothetical protein